MSTYGGKSTEEGQLESIARVKLAFPRLPPDFYKILLERVRELKICDDRFKDAVNHVVDTCQYPEPTIAQFLTFDNHIELFDYQQLLAKKEYEGKFSQYFKAVQVENHDKPLWAHVRDILLYNLKPYKNEKRANNKSGD